MYSFFQKYFILPTEELSGYNIVNTLTYALIFLVAFYILLHLVEKERLKINREFIISFIPFAFFGIFYRLRVDYGFVESSLLTVTPGAWVIPFALWMIFSYLFNYLFKNNTYMPYVFTSLIGFILLLILLTIYPPIINNYTFLIVYLLIFAIPFILSIKYSNYYILAFFGEFIDALGSYLGIKNGFYEEHVVPRFIISNYGLIWYPIIKLSLTLVVLYAISKLKLQENVKRFILLVIFILGFGPGTRNWFLLMYNS